MEKITKKQAEAALTSVTKQFTDYMGAGYEPPTLVWDYQQVYTVDGKIETRIIPCALVWEEGPFEWVHLVPEGGYDEELSSLAERYMEREAAPDWPADVQPEPANGHVMALSPR